MADLAEPLSSDLWSAEDPEEEELYREADEAKFAQPNEQQQQQQQQPRPASRTNGSHATTSDKSSATDQSMHHQATNSNVQSQQSTVATANNATQQDTVQNNNVQSDVQSTPSQASMERRCSRGRLLSKQMEIEEAEDEDHSPSSETSDATVIAAGLETPINDGSPETSPTEKKTSASDSSPDSDRERPQLQGQNSKSKVLVRSHALRDDCSPPPNEERLTAHSNNNHSSSPNTLAPTSKSSPRRRLEKSGSQNSDVSGTSPCLSRDSSVETQYTDATGIDLEEFIRSTLANNPKDRIMLLKLEQDLTAFIKDPKKDIHKFQSMTSYHRMLVHRVAAFFGLEHNVDQTGKAVIVNKTVNTRIPDFKFRDHIREDSLSLDEPKKLLKRGDSASFEEGKEGRSGSKRQRSFEEREEDYEKARARIFTQDSLSSQDGAVDSPGHEEIQVSGNRRWSCDAGQPWSSTDSSGYGTDSSGRVHLSMTKASSFGGVTVLSRGERAARVYKSVSVESKNVGTCTSPCPVQQTLLPPPLEVNPTVLWVALQPESVPIGSVIINPQTGQPYFNADGTLYRYSPNLQQQPWHHHQSMGNLSNLSPSSSLSSFGSTGQLAIQPHYTLRPQHAPRQYSGESNGSHDLSAPFSSMSLTSQSSTDSETNIPPLPQHQFASPQQAQPPQTIQHVQVAAGQNVPNTCQGGGQPIVVSGQPGQPYTYTQQQQVPFYSSQQQIPNTTQYYLPVQSQPPNPPPAQQQTPESQYAQFPPGQFQEGVYYPFNQSPSSETNQFYYQVARSSSSSTPPTQQQQQFYPQAVYTQVPQYQAKAQTQQQANKQFQGVAYPVQRASSPQMITYQNMTSPTHFPMVRTGVSMQIPQRTTPPPPPNLHLPGTGVKILYDRKPDMVMSGEGRLTGSATPPIQSPQQQIPTVQLPVRGAVPVGAVPGAAGDLRFYGAPIQMRPQIQPLFTARPPRLTTPLGAPMARPSKPGKNGSAESMSRSSSLGTQKSLTSPQEGGEVMNAGQQLLEVYDLPAHLKCQDLDIYLECLVVQGGKIHCIPPDEPNRGLSDCVVLIEFASPLVAQSILASANQVMAAGQNTGYKLRSCPQQITPKS